MLPKYTHISRNMGLTTVDAALGPPSSYFSSVSFLIELYEVWKLLFNAPQKLVQKMYCEKAVLVQTRMSYFLVNRCYWTPETYSSEIQVSHWEKHFFNCFRGKIYQCEHIENSTKKYRKIFCSMVWNATVTVYQERLQPFRPFLNPFRLGEM